MNAASQEDQQELCVGFDGVTPRAPHVAGLYQLCLTKVKSPRALEKEQNLKPILYCPIYPPRPSAQGSLRPRCLQRFATFHLALWEWPLAVALSHMLARNGCFFAAEP